MVRQCYIFPIVISCCYEALVTILLQISTAIDDNEAGFFTGIYYLNSVFFCVIHNLQSSW